MISYNEAVAIAKKKMKNVNRCDEDDMAYIFSYDNGKSMDGGQGSLVVLKENGRTMTMVYYVMHFSSGEVVKTTSV